MILFQRFQALQKRADIVTKRSTEKRIKDLKQSVLETGNFSWKHNFNNVQVCIHATCMYTHDLKWANFSILQAIWQSKLSILNDFSKFYKE